MNRLLCLENSAISFEVSEEPLTIGRACQPATLWQQLVPDEAARKTISRAHFEVRLSGSKSIVKNLSSNGILLNGNHVESDATLEDGDIISAGYIECEYGRRPALQLKMSLSQALPAPPPAREVVEISKHQVCLSSLGSNGSHKLCPGPMGSIRVGRSMQPPEFWCSLVPDENLRSAISRQHFEVTQKDKVITLVNMSLAGTLINGHMVQRQHKVQHGDIIAIPLHGRVHEAPPIVEFRVEIQRSSADEASKFKDVLDPIVEDVVVVKAHALPPPFSLVVEAGEIKTLPPTFGKLEAPFSKAQIIVGTEFQSAEFWTTLIPDLMMRETLSSRHFQISMSHRNDETILIVHAYHATEVNGTPVDGEVVVFHDDIVSIRPEAMVAPLLSFRVDF